MTKSDFLKELNTYIRKEMFDNLCEKYKKQLYVLFPLAEEDNEQLFWAKFPRRFFFLTL